MWIRTYTGAYINTAFATMFYTSESRLHEGEWSAMVRLRGADKSVALAVFNTNEDAQNFIDKLMGVTGERKYKVDMSEWNYTGHKKDHKETRRGGS